MPRPPQIKYKPKESILISIATPPDLLEAIRVRYDIDHDPCPLNGHLTGPDGLDRSIPWGKRNYINPPYTKDGIEPFVERAIEEMGRGNSSYVLVPFRASLKYYQRAMECCTGALYFASNIRFVGYKSALPQQLVLLEFEAGKPPKFAKDSLGTQGVWA
jgi:hypothetical protein